MSIDCAGRCPLFIVKYSLKPAQGYGYLSNTNGTYCIIDQGAWWMNILIAIIDRKASPVSFLLRDVSLYGIFNPW